MPVLPFGTWEPDQPALGHRGVVRAENVFPAATGFKPVPTWQASTNAIVSGNDTFTKVLLHFNGADASTTFTDVNAGGSAHTWTANGNAQIDTAQSKFGGGSGLFDGAGDSLTTPDNADLELAGGDFTIDCWFNCNAAAGSFRFLAGKADNVGAAATRSFDLGRVTGDVMRGVICVGSSTFTVTGTTVFTSAVNTGWHHIALVRVGGILKLFIDGVQEGGNVSAPGTVNDLNAAFAIGTRSGDAGVDWQGWIDEFRLSVGIARWTANFTPPTAPYKTATQARPLAAIRVRDFAGAVHFYAGDASTLYELAGANWLDRSKAGGYTTPTEERWEFVQFGELLLATNFGDSPQQITIGQPNFADLTTDFRARHITSLRNFAVVGNTFDATDLEVRNRLRWSAFNNPFSWTPSPSTLADFTDLQTGGEIRRVIGGEFGVIFQENSIRRMLFVGAPVVFQIDETLPGISLMAPGAAAQDGRIIYFLSVRGFMTVTDGVQLAQIGAEKVDRFVLSDLDVSNSHRISSAVDQVNNRVFWAYPGAGNISGRPNRIVVYDTVLQRWSLILFEAELVWQSGGVAQLVDDIMALVDSFNVTVDSSIFKGEGLVIGAFDAAFRSGSFDGDLPFSATIETGDRELTQDRRTHLSAFRAIIEGGTTTARIAGRSDVNASVVFGPTLAKTPSGRFTTRSNHILHRFRFNISDDWTNAIGIQFGPNDARPGAPR